MKVRTLTLSFAVASVGIFTAAGWLSAAEGRVPTIDLAASSDTGASNSDNVTRDLTPIIQGKAAPGAKVEIRNNGSLMVVTKANSKGEWRTTLRFYPGGDYAWLTATTKDGTSDVLYLAVESGRLQTSSIGLASGYDTPPDDLDGITTKRVLELKGALPWTLAKPVGITIYDNGKKLGSGTWQGAARWSFKTPRLDVGSHDFTAEYVDLAGNKGSSKHFQVLIIPPVEDVKVSEIDGDNGFLIMRGNAPREYLDHSVDGIGDVNGDGLNDVAVTSGNYSYVVFGAKAARRAPVVLSDLAGRSGFRLVTGAAHPQVTTAGDMNGDGIDDIAVGDIDALYGDVDGAVHVVFGRKSFPKEIDATKLDGGQGFTIVAEEEYSGFGNAVDNAGDVNNDGLSDLIVGASGANVDGRTYVGAAYVVYGARRQIIAQSSIRQLIELGRASKIRGNGNPDSFGRFVAGLGDVNGDGIGDVGVSAGANPSLKGKVHVFFGRNGGLPAAMSISDLNGRNGFSVLAPGYYKNLGVTLSGNGDVNGDGLSDIVISSEIYARSNYVKTFVIFGSKSEYDKEIFVGDLNGKNGFSIDAYTVITEPLGAMVGDVNGDDLSDISIGAPDLRYSGVDGSGTVSVIFGHAKPFSPSVSLDTGTASGYRIVGTKRDGQIGLSIDGAGDVNGDGIDDIVLGGSRKAEGAAVIVYGKKSRR